MVAGVLYSLWLHGRYHGNKKCRDVLAENNAVEMANSSQRKYLEEFLWSPEADEAVGVVLERWGSKAERW